MNDVESQLELACNFFIELIKENPNVISIINDPVMDRGLITVLVKSMINDEAMKLYHAHAETLRTYPGVGIYIRITD